MTYHDKQFVEVYREYAHKKKEVVILKELAFRRLQEIRDSEKITREEFTILSMRIRRKPASFEEIAAYMVEHQIVDKRYTRQRIEQKEKEILTKLDS